MFQFCLRFPKDCISEWAERYPAADDSVVTEIGARSRSAGYYAKVDFLEVCEWKTRGRPRRHYQSNSDDTIRRITSTALSSPDERTRIVSLIGAHGGLRGVSWPTASVLLHLAHKEPYPILDFRALWSLQTPERTSYTFDFWWAYVQACRSLADESGVEMRVLDRALWEYSRQHQLQQKKCESEEVKT